MTQPNVAIPNQLSAIIKKMNSAFNMNRFLFLLLLTIVLAMSTTSVVVEVQELKVGDSSCVQGFIMDYFCVKIKNMLDNGLPTLKQPEQHSVTACLMSVFAPTMRVLSKY